MFQDHQRRVGKVIVIDPFVTAIPRHPPQHKDLAKLGRST